MYNGIEISRRLDLFYGTAGLVYEKASSRSYYNMREEITDLETPSGAGYVEFPSLPPDATRNGEKALNRHSTFLTKDHDFPGAKVR